MNADNPMITENEHAELDRVLHAYFRAEAPKQWTPPAVSSSPMPARRPMWNGRMALAASLALLIGGLFFVNRNTHFESATGAERPSIDVASPAHKKPRTTSRPGSPEVPKPTQAPGK